MNRKRLDYKTGDHIRYRHFIGREKVAEERTGIIELRDHFSIPGAFGECLTYATENWLVLCTSCKHHRVDTVHPDDIIDYAEGRAA